jgi:hypothetical protein
MYLTESMPLTNQEVSSVLSFLTNRYAVRHEDLEFNFKKIETIINNLSNKDSAVNWYFDMSEWSVDSAYRIFTN